MAGHRHTSPSRCDVGRNGDVPPDAAVARAHRPPRLGGTKTLA
jgi:hypothetical protein